MLILLQKRLSELHVFAKPNSANTPTFRFPHAAFAVIGDQTPRHRHPDADARQRSLFGLALRTDLGRRLFLRSLRPNWLWLTPPPSNVWSVTERSDTRVTIEVARCYRWDAFCLLGAPEAASVACAFEEHMMNASPSLALSTRSMATGADKCRFCFERNPEISN